MLEEGEKRDSEFKLRVPIRQQKRTIHQLPRVTARDEAALWRAPELPSRHPSGKCRSWPKYLCVYDIMYYMLDNMPANLQGGRWPGQVFALVMQSALHYWGNDSTVHG